MNSVSVSMAVLGFPPRYPLFEYAPKQAGLARMATLCFPLRNPVLLPTVSALFRIPTHRAQG